MFEAGQCTLRNSMVTIVCMFQVVSISSQYKVAMLRVRNLQNNLHRFFSVLLRNLENYGMDNLYNMRVSMVLKEIIMVNSHNNPC
jgi:hypothetical protein